MIDSRQKVILQYLDIDLWCYKHKQQTIIECIDNNKNFDSIVIDTHLVDVILSTLQHKKVLACFLSAMFKHKKIQYHEYSTLDIKKIMASNGIIIYDERLMIEELGGTYDYRSFKIPIDKLTSANIKKQAMIHVYAVSDFTTK